MMTVEEYIEKKNPSKVTLELIEKLKRFSHDPDYIIGVLSDSKYDEDRQLIIDYIDHGEDVSYENVILFSLSVAIFRDKLQNNEVKVCRDSEHRQEDSSPLEMKVRYIGKPIVALDYDKDYSVVSIEKGWYRIMTELDEDYLFPPEAFEIIEN